MMEANLDENELRLEKPHKKMCCEDQWDLRWTVMIMDTAGILSCLTNFFFLTPFHDLSTLGENFDAILLLWCVFNFASILGAYHNNYYPVAANVVFRGLIFVVIGTLQMQSAQEHLSSELLSWAINAVCDAFALLPRIMFVWEAREGLCRIEAEPKSTASYSLIENEIPPCEEA